MESAAPLCNKHQKMGVGMLYNTLFLLLTAAVVQTSTVRACSTYFMVTS